MRYLFLMLISSLGFAIFMAIFLLFGATGLKILLWPPLVLGLPLSVWYTRRYYQIERSKAHAHMQSRPLLDSKQFGETYFPKELAEIAKRLRNILAAHLPLDLAGLHPDDKLLEELRMDVLDSMSMLKFVMQVENEFGINIPNSEAGKMRTFRDVFDHVIMHGHYDHQRNSNV